MSNTINTTKPKVGRPKKLQTLIQANGKVEKDISQLSTLEECWGAVNPLSAYGTINEQDYISKLREMNHSELENHARSKGVMFTNQLDGNRAYERLREMLLKEFRTYASSLNRPTHNSSNSAKMEEQVKKILSTNR